MAHGLPDYYRGVDIAYQALAEMITRPKYGSAQNTEGFVAATANDEKIVWSISGKGMIYGGYCYLDAAANQSPDLPRLYVDSTRVCNERWLDLYDWNLDSEHITPYYLKKYDAAAFKYCAGLSHGITFETSIELRYRETQGNAPDIYYAVYYALV